MVLEFSGLLDRLILAGDFEVADCFVRKRIRDLPSGQLLEEFFLEAYNLCLGFLGSDHAYRHAWSAAFESRLREEGLGPREEALLELLSVSLEISVGGLTSALERLDTIDWDSLDSSTWAGNLELLHRLRKGDLIGARRLLDAVDHRYCGTASPGGHYALAERLRVLAFHNLWTGQLDRFEKCVNRALTEYSHCPTLVGALRDYELRCIRALLKAKQCQAEEAQEEAGRALRSFISFGCPAPLSRRILEIAIAFLQIGDRVEAERFLRYSENGSSGSGPRSVYLGLASEVALLASNLVQSRSHLRELDRVLTRYPHTRLRAKYHLLMARTELEESFPRLELVERELDKADALLVRIQQNRWISLSDLLELRGRLHLLRGDKKQALDCCMRSLEHARRHRVLSLQARALLLKSWLLVDGELPAADQTYEEVMRDLGLINDPILLFKVIANLYLYTWKLDESALDLSQHHLQQLEDFRSLLEPELFARLYREHVTRRVFDRFNGADGRKTKP